MLVDCNLTTITITFPSQCCTPLSDTSIEPESYVAHESLLKICFDQFGCVQYMKPKRFTFLHCRFCITSFSHLNIIKGKGNI